MFFARSPNSGTASARRRRSARTETVLALPVCSSIPGRNDFSLVPVGRKAKTRAAHPWNYWRIFAKDADRRIARAIRTSIGNRLRETYSRLVQERLPPKIADLLSRLDRNPPANG